MHHGYRLICLLCLGMLLFAEACNRVPPGARKPLTDATRRAILLLFASQEDDWVRTLPSK